jgi:hypothetical protein
VLTAFDADGAPQTGAAAVLVPGGGLAPIALAPRVSGARLATLEHGVVVAIGGADTVARYVPTTNSWLVTTPAGDRPSLSAPVLVRIADGSVLALGGSATTADAWIYRPALVGPSSGSVVAVPDGSTEGVLTPSDPSLVDRSTNRFILTAAADDYAARALVGGPRIADGSVSAIVRIQAGGVALVAQQTGPGRAVVARLVPGEPARIEQLSLGMATTLCTGSAVTEVELMAPVTLAISSGTATVSVGGTGTQTVKATCGVSTSERGAWGVAAAGAGARVDVGPVTVARTR